MFGWPFDLVLALLVCAMALSFVRLLLGPGLLDRIVALDTLGMIAIGFLIALSLATGRYEYIDVALTLALVAFLATVALARYAERDDVRDGRAGES